MAEFGDSESRADILTVQFDDDGGLVLDIIEIKTLEETSGAYTVKDEDGTKVVEGNAVDQVFETTDTIRGLFTGDKTTTTSPRKEALREQLYYELTSAEGMEGKQEWADRINDVFNGDAQIEINPRIVSVEVTSEATSDERIDGVTPNAQSIRVDKLPRQSIKRLIVSGIEDREDQRPEQDADEEAVAEEERAKSTKARRKSTRRKPVGTRKTPSVTTKRQMPIWNLLTGSAIPKNTPTW